jgi:hypothetical protein
MSKPDAQTGRITLNNSCRFETVKLNDRIFEERSGQPEFLSVGHGPGQILSESGSFHSVRVNNHSLSPQFLEKRLLRFHQRQSWGADSNVHEDPEPMGFLE